MPEKADLQDYLFDLRGFIIIKQAVSPDLVARLNQAIDPYLDLQYLEWRGNVQRFDNNGNAGIELQNIVAGQPHVVGFGHAVAAPKIAAIGHAEPQAAERPAPGVMRTR